ncbi:MAG: ATP-dependent 6-phosphofructokinase [Alphaproteobacteria bacterium]|nr:ATP-dependent 6-phosphofructokinase [Alphaproteobacteria bacterium]
MGTHRVGILTGGGDAPGLNAVLRAFVKRAVGQLRWDVIGIEDSFNGLLERPFRVVDMTLKSCSGLLARGGTVLGTTNRGDPFSFGPDKRDRTAEIVDAMADLDLEGLVVIGGDGTQKIGLRMMRERGVKVVGVPKTIDNDLSATDTTFGFHSAVSVATEALDRLHTTAESHDRVMLLEVMGRDAGHIALHAGLAGGADCIVIPEIPYDVDRICRKIDKRRGVGRMFTLIVVAEGATPRQGAADAGVEHGAKGRILPGGASMALARALAERREVDVRVTVLGHLQRGGSPIPYDRILATRLGVGAVDLVDQERWGEITVLRDGHVIGVPIEDAVRVYRRVDPAGEMVRTARAVGIEFGG